MQESPKNLDPSVLNTPALQALSRLMFESLTDLDDRGRPEPLLAISWQAEPGNQRWRFFLRRGVFFSDGTPLDANAVVASLRNSSPDWKAVADGESVVIETGAPDPDVPAELALARHSIVRRSGANVIGTGAFRPTNWTAGRNIALAANNQYWGGRPFLDAVQVQFGKNYQDQMMSLDLKTTDIAEIAPENIRRAQSENRNVMASEPEELIALSFAHDPASENESHQRNLLAASIDSVALSNVVMQGGGEATAAFLPTWQTGYGFIFQKPATAMHGLAQTQKSVARWTLSFDAAEPVDRVIAERVALNARDAGISIQLSNSPDADLRLVRLPLASLDPHVALTEWAQALQLPHPRFDSGSVADLYSAERVLLQSHRVVPLVHVRSAVAFQLSVHELAVSPNGVLNLQNAWLSAERQ